MRVYSAIQVQADLPVGLRTGMRLSLAGQDARRTLRATCSDVYRTLRTLSRFLFSTLADLRLESATGCAGLARQSPEQPAIQFWRDNLTQQTKTVFGCTGSSTHSSCSIAVAFKLHVRRYATSRQATIGHRGAE